MRYRSLVLLSALLMLLTGCAQEAPAEPIFAIVEGVEIPVSRVDHTLALDEAAYEFSLRWIEDADFLTEEEKQEQIALMEPPTREAAEQELIRMEVLNARAREAGITVTQEEARARLDETNAIAEELAAQGEKSAVWTRDFLTKYAEEQGLTYEEYEEQQAVPALQEQMARGILSEQIGALHWEAYVEEALAEADIIYP